MATEQFVVFNRLLPSPVSDDFQHNLRNEVRDALWTLSRQWQMGEWEGEDSGSAVTVRVTADHWPVKTLTRTQSTAMGESVHAQNMGLGALPLPLEPMAECETLQVDLALRISWGHFFRKMLPKKINDYPDLFGKILDRFKLKNAESVFLEKFKTDPDAKALYGAVAETALDGFAIFEAMSHEKGQQRSDFENWVADLYIEDFVKEALVSVMDGFKAFVSRAVQTPATGVSAWKSNRQEYAFGLGLDETDTHLVAPEYHGGRLDWYHFDLKPELVPVPALPTKRRTYLPTEVVYPGMPLHRHWAMESSRVNFGKIQVGATGLLDMLLIDFALVYGNNWLLFPYTMPVNTLCKITELTVTDNFGIATSIPAANLGDGSNGQPWAMFNLSKMGGSGKSYEGLFLPAALPAILEAPVLEKVVFRRDEMANLVWAHHPVLPGLLGVGLDGYEATLPEEREDPSSSRWKYRLGSDVPRNWTPLVPVQMAAGGQIWFQRARLPQDAPGSKAPLGLLLTENTTPAGFDSYGNPRKAWFIHEEEIPRAGIGVERHWQRSRWINGQTFVWVGRQKRTESGEARSGLRFDFISPASE